MSSLREKRKELDNDDDKPMNEDGDESDANDDEEKGELS
jgi:hypothetical protein